MPRKPIHLTPAGAPTSRDLLWAEMRRRRRFTMAEIASATGVKHSTAQDFFRGLVVVGYLAPDGEVPSPLATSPQFSMRTVYLLVRDCGVDAPRLRRDGTEYPVSGRERMWRAMRVLGEFSARDLAAHASVGGPEVALAEADTYCKYLRRAGYLLVSGSGAEARFRFIPSRYTGPRPPMIQRVRRIWDPNLGKVVWEAKPKEEAA